MSSANVERAEQIFGEVRLLPPDARRAAIGRACEGDDALRREVESLLRYDERETAFLDEPAFRFAPATPGVPPATESAPPESIGPYRIRKQLGEGGMGAVYLAEQLKPVRRLVALKVIKRGMNTDQVIARFEAERQALAMMDHPNIARVFDAGATEDGRPYFVMEHVAGRPINQYCDDARMDMRARLELFINVCDAIQHAHQKGLIHRDIKPSNLLVADVDGKPAVKVIDFGIAKAMQQPLTERTLFTETGQLVGTPEYMAPEQADLSGQNVDTRADIYSLGVLLYELLVGTLPFDPTTLREGGFAEIQRIIREVEPPRPSTRLSSLTEREHSSAATKRRMDPVSLRRELAGDLDWITMKALEKDRNRRFASASEFAEEIRRHLRHEPVLAGPPSATYRIRKFVRRNRAAVAGTVAVAIVVVAGGVAATVLGLRAAREYRRAEAVNDFLLETLIGSDPFALGESPSEDAMKARLDFAAEQVDGILGQYPEAVVEVRVTLAQAYEGLSYFDEAEQLARRARTQATQHLGKNHILTIRATDRHALTLRQLSRNPEVVEIYEELLPTARRVLGHEHEQTLGVQNNLAMALKHVGRVTESEDLYRQTLDARRRILGRNHRSTIISISNLARLLIEKGDLSEAETLLRDAIRASEVAFGPTHPHTLLTIDQLGTTMRDLGRLDEAVALHRQAYEGLRDTLGEDHVNTLGARYYLTQVLVRQRSLDDAEIEYRQLLDVCRSSFGEESNYTLTITLGLCDVLRRQENFDDAEALLGPAIALHIGPEGPAGPLELRCLAERARLLSARGSHEEARDEFQRVRVVADELFGPDDVRSVRLQVEQALCYRGLKQNEQALDLLRPAVRTLLHAESAAQDEIAHLGAAALMELLEEQGLADESADLAERLADLTETTTQ